MAKMGCRVQEEKGVPPGGSIATGDSIGAELGRMAGTSAHREEEGDSRGRAQPRPRGRKAGDGFGDWPFCDWSLGLGVKPAGFCRRTWTRVKLASSR